MKRLLFLAFVSLVIMSCEKSDDTNDIKPTEKRSGRLYIDNAGVKSGKTMPFSIISAAIVSDSMSIAVEYTGEPESGHFRMEWSGEIKKEDGLDVAELFVYNEKKDGGNGSAYVDSLLLSMVDIHKKISNKKVSYRLINAYNNNNSVFIKYTEDGGSINGSAENTKGIEVFVVDNNCGVGAIDNLWFKGVGNDNNNIYYVPLKISDKINYKAKVNDRLKLDIDYTYLKDSTKVCDSWKGKEVLFIDINAVSKMN